MATQNILLEYSAAEFAQRLSSKEPIPGGGGAAAYAGALGVALGGMVANLTIGKPRYADIEDDLQGLRTAATEIQEGLLSLVEKDAEAFAPLSDAYRMASATESEKAEKERVMQLCLKDAALVPLEIMEKSAEALPILEALANKGTPLAVSDAGCGAALLKAAVQAGWLNVRVNTRLIKDEQFAAQVNGRAMDILENSLAFADRIYREVEEKLS